MLTKDEMVSRLKSMGLKRAYKPYNDESNSERDPANQIILLETRKPATITDGVMSGAAIDVYDGSTIRVWTSQKKKASDIAKTNGFNIRRFDGEAELYIPVDRADEFLHGLGAKVGHKRPISPEVRAKRIEALAKYRASKRQLAETAQ